MSDPVMSWADLDVRVASVDSAAVIAIRQDLDHDELRAAVDAIHEHYRNLAEARGIPAGTPACLALPLVVVGDVEFLTEADMAEHGWVRAT